MLPSEDQKTEHDIHLHFYEEEYLKARERFRERQRSQNLLRQLSLNRDVYRVTHPDTDTTDLPSELRHALITVTTFSSKILTLILRGLSLTSLCQGKKLRQQLPENSDIIT